MSSKTEIVNLALTHLGVGKEVANFETEKSEEAAAANRVYATARDVVLVAADWSFATSIAALGLVETEPNSEWCYSYRYPSDCLKLRRILSGIRKDDRQSKVPYKIVPDTAGKLIYTDEEDAEAEYTARIDTPQMYPPLFVTAFSFYLAFLMAPRLTQGDQFKLGEKALKLYDYTLGQAIATDSNEEARDEEPLSEMERARQ